MRCATVQIVRRHGVVAGVVFTGVLVLAIGVSRVYLGVPPSATASAAFSSAPRGLR